MVVLSERLMRAADPLIQHGEYLECWITVRTETGERNVECRLTGRTKGAAELWRWSAFENKLDMRATRAIAFDKIGLPEHVAERLESIASYQEMTPVQRAEYDARLLREAEEAAERARLFAEFKAWQQACRARGRDRGGRYHNCGPSRPRGGQA